jgi:WD40 repeat protein
LIAGATTGKTPLLFLDGSPARVLEGFEHQTWGVAFSSDGRLAAAVGGEFNPADRVIRIWDVETGEPVQVFEVGEKTVPYHLEFTTDGDLLSMSESGLYQWNVATAAKVRLFDRTPHDFGSSSDGQRIVVQEQNASKHFGVVWLLDRESNSETRMDSFEDDVFSVALHPNGGFIATGDQDGEIRVGLLDRSEPHLLVGHESTVFDIAIDPLGRWIASASVDGTIRLWPMPDLSKPPLHTLPREELIAKLKTLTNLRVVRDPGSATGWKLTHDPFPGWETVPTW